MRKLLLPFTLSFLSITAVMVSSPMVKADDSLKGKAKETASDTKRGAKESVRNVKDKTCELVNGKMECAVQKTKHTIQKGADKVEDAID